MKTMRFLPGGVLWALALLSLCQPASAYLACSTHPKQNLSTLKTETSHRGLSAFLEDRLGEINTRSQTELVIRSPAGMPSTEEFLEDDNACWFMTQPIDTTTDTIALEANFTAQSTQSDERENLPEPSRSQEDSLDIELEGAENNELPLLPEGFELNEAGEDFSLSVIRPIPIVEAQIRSSVLSGWGETTDFDNSFNPTDSFSSTVLVNSAALRISPEIGQKMRVEGGIQLSHLQPISSDKESEFSGLSGSDYNVFDADLGMRYELDQSTSLRLGWKYQKLSLEALFSEDFSDHQIGLNLARVDSISDRSFLTTNYVANVNLANRSPQNRWSNAAGVGVAYALTPQMLAQLDYRLKYTNYFRSKDALSHRVGAQITYIFDDNLSIGGSAAYQFGEAINLFNPKNNPEDVNNLSFGLHLNIDIPFAY